MTYWLQRALYNICRSGFIPMRECIPTGPTRVTGETILWVTVVAAAQAPASAPCRGSARGNGSHRTALTITHKSTVDERASPPHTPLEAVGTYQLIISFANPYLNLNKRYSRWGGIMGKLSIEAHWPEAVMNALLLWFFRVVLLAVYFLLYLPK